MHIPLKKYIKHGSAFGPTDASLIAVEDKMVLKELFDPQNKIYDALRLNPSIVIGRRGSGKTAYLHSVFVSEDYKVVQEIRTSKNFSKIVAVIEKNMPNYALAEDVAELWQELFYLTLMSELSSRYPQENRELTLIADFVAKTNPNQPDSLGSLLWGIVQKLRTDTNHSLASGIADVIHNATGIKFNDAKQIMLNLLGEKKLKAILLLDSLEQYPMHIHSVTHALSGLLKCAGQFTKQPPAKAGGLSLWTGSPDTHRLNDASMVAPS